MFYKVVDVRLSAGWISETKHTTGAFVKMICHTELTHVLSIKIMASTMVLNSVMMTGIEATRQRRAAILPHVKMKVFCNSQGFCFPSTDFNVQQSKGFVCGTSTSRVLPCCSTGSEPTNNSIIKLAGYDPNSLTAHHLRHRLDSLTHSLTHSRLF